MTIDVVALKIKSECRKISSTLKTLENKHDKKNLVENRYIIDRLARECGNSYTPSFFKPTTNHISQSYKNNDDNQQDKNKRLGF